VPASAAICALIAMGRFQVSHEKQVELVPNWPDFRRLLTASGFRATRLARDKIVAFA